MLFFKEHQLKRYTKEERARFIVAWKESGKSVKDFSFEQNININTFKYWASVGETTTKDKQAFLPITIINENERRIVAEPCVIKIGGLFSVECRSTSNLKSIELALKAALNVCGLQSKN